MVGNDILNTGVEFYELFLKEDPKIWKILHFWCKLLADDITTCPSYNSLIIDPFLCFVKTYDYGFFTLDNWFNLIFLQWNLDNKVGFKNRLDRDVISKNDLSALDIQMLIFLLYSQFPLYLFLQICNRHAWMHVKRS